MPGPEIIKNVKIDGFFLKMHEISCTILKVRFGYGRSFDMEFFLLAAGFVVVVIIPVVIAVVSAVVSAVAAEQDDASEQ